MYKKAWCTSKVLVLPCQAINAYMTFSSPQHLKLPNNDTLLSVKNNILGANWIAPAYSIPHVFLYTLVVPSFLVRKVENKSFPWTHKLGERSWQVRRDDSRRVWTHEKNSRETVRRLGTIIQSIFCAQSGSSQRLLELLEIVWWESVPMGSFARTWILSPRLFSRPDCLPLGLWGWLFSCLKNSSRFPSFAWQR